MFIYSCEDERYYNSNEIVAVYFDGRPRGIAIQAIIKGFAEPIDLLHLSFDPDDEKSERKAYAEAQKAMNELACRLNGEKNPLSEYF